MLVKILTHLTNRHLVVIIESMEENDKSSFRCSPRWSVLKDIEFNGQSLNREDWLKPKVNYEGSEDISKAYDWWYELGQLPISSAESCARFVIYNFH